MSTAMWLLCKPKREEKIRREEREKIRREEKDRKGEGGKEVKEERGREIYRRGILERDKGEKIRRREGKGGEKEREGGRERKKEREGEKEREEEKEEDYRLVHHKLFPLSFKVLGKTRAIFGHISGNPKANNVGRLRP
jgi:hypothetical protein